MVSSISRAVRSPSSNSPALWRGSISEVRSDGMVYVIIPKLVGSHGVGPIPVLPAGLQIGDSVIVGAIGNDLSDMMVLNRTEHEVGQSFIVPGTTADYWRGDKTWQPLDSAAVGLGNVQNTGDADKPVSVAQAAALALKAPLASPTFTGTVSGVSKGMVGLGSVDNTADSAKPVSTVQAAALATKAPLASPSFTGTVSGVTKAMVGLGNVDNTTDASKPISTAQVSALAAKAPLSSPTFTGTVTGITKAMVGLPNVDNTTDLSKPLSTATQTALSAKIAASEKGVPGGVAALDSNTVVPRGNTVFPEAQTFAGWRNAVAKMETSTVRALHIGDSITEGTGVTNFSDTWPHKLMENIRNAYPAIAGNSAKSQQGWTPINQSSSSMVSNWTMNPNGGGGIATSSNFGFRFTKSGEIADGATVTGTATGTSIDIWFTKGSATGTFTVKVDGVQKGGTYGGTSPAVTDGFFQRVSLGSRGAHSITITAQTSSCYINGVTVYDGNESSGIVGYNAGVHGTKSTDWATTGAHPLWRQNVATLDPHLVVIMLGANDYMVLFQAN